MLTSLIWTLSCFAGDVRPKNLPQNLCELKLGKHQVGMLERDLDLQFFGKTFSFHRLLSNNSTAIKKLTNGEKSEPNLIEGIQMTVLPLGAFELPEPVNVELHFTAKSDIGVPLSFHEKEPKIWQSLSQSRLPPRHWRESVMDSSWVGFHSEFDGDGVRRYVVVDHQNDFYVYATLGIDVPCEKVNKYAGQDGAVVQQIFSANQKFCRIPILSFVNLKRVESSNENISTPESAPN